MTLRIIGSVIAAVSLLTAMRTQQQRLGFGARLTLTLALTLCFAGCNRGDHPGQLGESAPDFTLHNGQQTVRLSQFRGKILILNFWATWCAPCIDELPSLQQLQRDRPDIQVLAVSIDDDANAYTAFLKQYDINLLSMRDGSQGANLRYGSVRVPETFILDRNGIVRRKFIGAQQWTNPEILGYLAKV